jgi:hypothetical protein
VQAAGDLLAEAVEEIESDGKLSQAGDLFRQAIGEGSWLGVFGWPFRV